MNRFDTASASEGTAQSPGEPARDLFPLPLSPFEPYMALDDTDAYPMTFVLLIKLKGNLLREPFQHAVHIALKRHPLLASRICHIPGKGTCWVPVATAAPQLFWGNSQLSQHFALREAAVWERIDLAREIGLRISVDADSDRADVLFGFHHACTDGIGAVQFIGDLLRELLGN